MKYFLCICVALIAVCFTSFEGQAQERFRSRRVAILDQRGDLVRAQAQLLQQQNIARLQNQQRFVVQRNFHVNNNALLQQQLLLNNLAFQQQALQPQFQFVVPFSGCR